MYEYHAIVRHLKELKKLYNSVAVFIIVIGHQVDAGNTFNKELLEELEVPTSHENFPCVFNLSATGEFIWHAQLCGLLLSLDNVTVACIHQFDLVMQRN